MNKRGKHGLATLALIGLAVGGVASRAEADPIVLETPADLTEGETSRIIFVTTATTAATSSSMSHHDSFVTTDAAGATYDGSVVSRQAIGSTSSVNAIDHIGTNPGIQGVYLADGTVVTGSDDISGLWSPCSCSAWAWPARPVTPGVSETDE